MLFLAGVSLGKMLIFQCRHVVVIDLYFNHEDCNAGAKFGPHPVD